MARPPGHGPAFEGRRQEIIDQAASLFAQKGYASTGIAELGKAVGLGKGALYHYIGSKENLLVEIQDRVLQPLLARARVIESLDADPLVRLRLLSEALLEAILARLDHIWVYEHDYRHLTGANRKRLVRQRREFEWLLQGLLEEAIEEGSLRRTDPRLAALQFLNLHNHTYQWARTTDPSWTAARLSGEYCRTLFGGLATDPATVDGLEERAAGYRATLAGS
jgi:AcrR family transcriptional regulator